MFSLICWNRFKDSFYDYKNWIWNNYLPVYCIERTYATVSVEKSNTNIWYLLSWYGSNIHRNQTARITFQALVLCSTSYWIQGERHCSCWTCPLRHLLDSVLLFNIVSCNVNLNLSNQSAINVHQLLTSEEDRCSENYVLLVIILKQQNYKNRLKW